MSLPPVENRHVLVTGCSSGIGHATAQLLREQGWSVYPTVRGDDDFERLQSEGFDPLRLHIDRTESVEDAVKELKERTGGTLGALVNNAGCGHLGPLEDLDRDGLRHQLDVNVIGVHHLINLCLPAMLAQGSGRIVNIGSILGLVSIPFCGAYAASKFALEALTDALRAELAGTGVGVSLVGPGPIVSSFRDNAARLAQATDMETRSRFGTLISKRLSRLREQGAHSARSLPPEAVARKVLHALESSRPRGRYAVTLEAHVIELALRCLPRSVVQWIMARKVRRVTGTRK